MLFLSVTNFLLSVVVNSYSYFQNLFRPDCSEAFPQHLLLQNSSLTVLLHATVDYACFYYCVSN